MLCNTWCRKSDAARTSLVRGFALAGLVLCLTTSVQAQIPAPQIIKVEEDWELHVATPDPVVNVPQVICVFGPADVDTDTHAIFEINHSTAPNFMSGGMQLQCWWQDYLLGYGNHPNNREFDAAVDQITFTTRTELKNGRLYLEIDNGDSVNWGSFGGEGYLRMSLETNRQNLNNYDADSSLNRSRIAYGKNRVNRYVRTEVRYYTAQGLYQTDEDDNVVFSQE